ncbi:MAG: DUF1405 domain-containing protein [Candidatus Micrarchaeia archaeon]
MEPDWRSLFIPVVLLNVAAVFAGIYFYIDQLAATPLHLLAFVPDCPLYVFLSLLIILGIARNKTFQFIVSVGMVKYGLWTVFAIFFHSGYYFAPGMLAISAILVAGHLGMALEGLALLPEKPARLALALALAWFLLNDVSDYSWGTVPSLPPGGLELVRNITFASSIALPLAFFAFAARLRKFPPARWLQKILLPGATQRF